MTNFLKMVRSKIKLEMSNSMTMTIISNQKKRIEWNLINIKCGVTNNKKDWTFITSLVFINFII